MGYSVPFLTFLVRQGYCFDKVREIVIPRLEKSGNLTTEDL